MIARTYVSEAVTTENRLVVVGASAGGITAFLDMVEQLPTDLSAPIIFVTHLQKDRESFLEQVFDRRTRLEVSSVEHGQRLQANHIHVCVPGRHVIVRHGFLQLSSEIGAYRFVPSINRTLQSAADTYGEGLTVVILSGMLDDGVDGLLRVYETGGLCMVQSPEEAQYPSMPVQALLRDHPAFALPVKKIAEQLGIFDDA